MVDIFNKNYPMKLVPNSVHVELLEFMHSGCPYQMLYDKELIRSYSESGLMTETWKFISEDQEQCNYFMLNLRAFFGEDGLDWLKRV
jgi:hypothetical protein